LKARIGSTTEYDVLYDSQELSRAVGVPLADFPLLRRKWKIPSLKVGRRVLYPLKVVNDDGTDLTPEDKDRAFYRDKLVEQDLLKKAVFLDVKADGESLAVPVGKVRRGGMLEFSDKREARKAVRLLAKHRGFSNARIVEISACEGIPDAYWQVRWGDAPPFDGLGQDVSCNILLGIHYGYSDEAIAGFADSRLKGEGRSPDREKLLTFIRSARHPR
jgi:Family of unknown function (DUF6302)